MSDIVERLRSVIAGDYDTNGTLSFGGRCIADVPLIRDASDVAECCHEAAAHIEAQAAEIARLRAALASAEFRDAATMAMLAHAGLDNRRLRAALASEAPLDA